MRKRAILAVSVNTPNRSVEDFGSNEWLVEELYEQFKSDKNSVDRSWWPFFEQYEAEGGSGSPASGNGAPTTQSAQGSGKASAERKAGASSSASQCWRGLPIVAEHRMNCGLAP